MDDSNEQGSIITFYSFKGGTGRSMALANLGYLFSRAPSSHASPVLLIDWDLEAPGLHTFFESQPNDAPDVNHAGLIDYFYDLRNMLRADEQLYEKIRNENGWRALAEAVPLDKYITKIKHENLYLIKAGRLD